MSNLNTNYDNNDFDNFLNLDNEYTPVSVSPAVPSLAHHGSVSSSASLASSQPTFSGPTYQYDSFRQQTGLPMGGLANTFAVNQASGLHYRPNAMGFVMPTETLNIPLSNLDDFEFDRSQLDMADMDFDADSPTDLSGMFGSSSTQIKSESSQSTPVQRIYPGIHTQQAAQAKQRQQEMFRQQQEQKPKQVPGQLPLPTQAPKTAKDPLVEESISRLLSRMRQSSTSSVDEDGTPTGGMSNIVRPKKDEEDMDDDERLLASEEGKKLSSKERRQLRNKVSARAFRSRRKEYIGQLEGEVAAKVQENNDLRTQNRQLMEENTRLTDLTRMLLSSQSFSGFLQELSNSSMTVPSIPTTQQSQPPQQQMRKDVSVHEASRQLQSQTQQHVGMTLIPDTTIDVTDFSNNWNVPSLPSNDFQVFSVTALPEPATLDLSVLSEKKAEKTEDSCFLTAAKPEAPELPSLPPSIEAADTVETINSVSDESVDEDDSDLYAVTVATSSETQSVKSLIASLYKPTTETANQSATKLQHETEAELSTKLDRMCIALDESCTRLEQFLP